VHDRRIEGKTYVFGNHGALWMNAMTWWDHETQSIWSQPWGRALVGPLKGTQLKLLPFSLVPWNTWRSEHPDTLALIVEGFNYGTTPRDEFVAGVAIGDLARGYPYPIIAELMVVNDLLGTIPVVVHTNPNTRSIHIFVRQLSDGTILTFTGTPDTLIDDQTGSTWNPVRGIATDGELKGQGIRELPYISSFDWAWLDFYPHSDFYEWPVK
jgi:hypothetical protein